MNRMSYTVLVSLLALSSGCKSPFDRTRDASGDSGTGSITGGANMVVFSNELKTGGGAFLYPGSENQTLSFADTSNPVSGRSIRYAWNGQDVSSSGGAQHVFAGFDLMHTISQSDYATTSGRDLRSANYGHVTFYARGSLSSNAIVKVEVADDGNTGTSAPCVTLSATGTADDNVNVGSSPCLSVPGGQLGLLSSSWRQFSIPVNNSNLNNLKDFFKATFIDNGGGSVGGGGTVYFDQIVYTP